MTDLGYLGMGEVFGGEVICSVTSGSSDRSRGIGGLPGGVEEREGETGIR